MTPARRPGLRRAARLAAALALALAAPLSAAGLATEAAAMSPLPFFQRVARVGLLCAVDPADGGNAVATPAAPLSEETLCRRAAAALSGLLASGPAVVPFTANDDRIADPAALLVLLHATLRAEDGRRLLAVAATLHRAGADAGAPPFFMMPPQALTVAGSLDDAALDAALRRLLGPLAQALHANP